MLHKYKSSSRRAFEVFNYAFFVLFSIAIIVPFFHVISISLSSNEAIVGNTVGIWPDGFNVVGYKTILNNPDFLRSFINTVGLTTINTILTILIALFAAYALSSKHIVGRKTIFTYILVTMFFSGGLVPFYLLVNNIGLSNTYFALILPNVCSGFIIIIFKNVMDQLPRELLESAEMDGAGEYRTLFRIVLPLVLPMTAAFTIISAVGFWNEWFGVMLFIRDKVKYTLQFQLREILVDVTQANLVTGTTITFADLKKSNLQNLRMSALMITIIPIVIIYPFLQRYFIHGVLVGAVKG